MGMSCLNCIQRDFNTKYFIIRKNMPILTTSFSSVYSNRSNLTFISARFQLSDFMELNLEENFKSISHDIFHSAGLEDFASNLVAYGRYFISVMVGTTYMMTRPITNLLNDRNTMLLAVCGLMGVAYFVYFTLY